jgi:hypothetical protein
MSDIDSTEPSITARPTAGLVYGPLINAQVEDEQARKTSLEQRGLAVITTSGVLVSLLFGLGAIGVKRFETLGLPLPAMLLLIAALLAFVSAAGLGLATNRPRTYVALALEDMQRMVSLELWEKAQEPAARRVAENRVGIIATARKHNATKASLLQWAIAAESAGVALVALSVVDLLIERS